MQIVGVAQSSQSGNHAKFSLQISKKNFIVLNISRFWKFQMDYWARHIYPSLVLVKPRKTRHCLTEILLMGRKESKQTSMQA